MNNWKSDTNWDAMTTSELIVAARQIGIGEMRIVPDDLLCEVWALRELVASLATRLRDTAGIARF